MSADSQTCNMETCCFDDTVGHNCAVVVLFGSKYWVGPVFVLSPRFAGLF